MPGPKTFQQVLTFLIGGVDKGFYKVKFCLTPANVQNMGLLDLNLYS